MSNFQLVTTEENNVESRHIDEAITDARENLGTGLAIKTAKGNVIGRKYIFDLGDTKALKENIKRLNPDWSMTKVGQQVAVLRRDGLSRSRMEAALFVEMQYAQGNVAIAGDHKNTGKSVLRFEKASVAEAPSEATMLKMMSLKLSEKLGCTIEEAAAMLK
jgi:hypothetical protein